MNGEVPKEASSRKKIATPLPKAKLAVVCLIMFADYYGVLLILPFLPFMVSDFFPKLDRTEIGQKAGFLGSAYYIGCLIGSFMWGWLADIIGRRPAFLCSVSGIIVSFALFGFSKSFEWAISARVLWGMLDGITGLSKTYISEICDETNQARGFALIATMGGTGRLFGSLTGGFLARPASKYPLLNTPFFCDFPYVLPCLVGVAVLIVSLIMGWFFLDETMEFTDHKSNNTDHDPTLATNDDVVSSSVTVVSDVEGDDCQPLLGPSVQRNRKARMSKVKSLVKKARHKLCTIATLMKDRRVFLSTAIYGLFCFSGIIFYEIFPLIMVTSYHSGGYDMDDNEIGLFLSIAAFTQIPYLVLIYPLVAKLLGYRHSFRLGAAVFVIGCVLMPLANRISGPIGNSQSNGSNVTFTTITWNSDITDYNDDHFDSIWSFSTTYGSNHYPLATISSNRNETGTANVNSVDSFAYVLLDNNNSTNITCHKSRLESFVGKNSISRIPVRVWLTVSGILITCAVGRLTAFTSISVMVGNSVLPAGRGTVNGIGQSLAALGRSLGPLVAAPIFSWSIRNGDGWPLNHHFIYDTVTAMITIIILFSFALPMSSEKKRISEDGQKSQVTLGSKSITAKMQ